MSARLFALLGLAVLLVLAFVFGETPSAAAPAGGPACPIHETLQASDAFTPTHWLYLPLTSRGPAAPRADFTAAPAAGLAPLTVAFTNTSTGDYTASLWAFGDGLTSTLPSPAHVYATPGHYTVTLTVAGPGGNDTQVRPDAVAVYEMRALWVSRFDWTSSSDPATPARIDDIVSQAAAARFNTLFFQVRGQADAFYASGLEPWSARLNADGELGRDPGWDPLAYLVTRAHAAGLSVHAYINVYPAWLGETPPISTTTPIHPFWTWSWWPGRDWADWRHWTASGPMLLNSDYLWASPGAPPAADHIVAVAADIMDRYDVDGLHLDYVRYAGSQYSCDPFSVERFGGTCFSPGWQDWQRAQISNLVQRIYQARPANRTVLLSAAAWPVYMDRWGWGTSQGWQDYYQDSQGWAQAGVIDAIVPMWYYWGTDRFEVLAHDFKAHSGGRGVVAGIWGNYADFGEIAARIQIGRAAGLAGHAVFSYGLLKTNDCWDEFVAPGGPHADPTWPFP